MEIYSWNGYAKGAGAVWLRGCFGHFRTYMPVANHLLPNHEATNHLYCTCRTNSGFAQASNDYARAGPAA